MFCPKCGIGNLVDQKFCRGCGHALGGHKAALENNFEDTVETIKSGSTVLGASAAVLIIISLMDLAVWIFQNDAGVFFTLVPVLAFVIPVTILGLVRLNRAYRALSATNRGNLKAIEQSKTTAVHLTAAGATDPLAQPLREPASVTEHTTLNLESPGPASGEARGSRQVDSPSSAS
jgi:zinc ribbon protein